MKKLKVKKKYKYFPKSGSICQPLINKYNSYVIKECDVFDKDKYKHIIKEFPEYMGYNSNILIVDYLGIDLEQFVKHLFNNLTRNDKNIFLTKIIDLFEAVDFFRKQKIIHHDIKDNNIMYNPYTTDIKIIDYGLMITYKEYYKNSLKSKNKRAVSHANFPPENSCVNKNEFEKKYGCKNYKNSISYKKFLNRTSNTFDTYSLTLYIAKILNKIKKSDKYYTHFCNNVILYLTSYYDNILYRNYDLSYLIKKYKCLLIKYKIYNTSKKITTSNDIISNIVYKIHTTNTKETKYEFTS